MTSQEEPIQEQYIEQMNALAAAIDHLFNGDACFSAASGKGDEKQVGFALLVFPFHAVGRCNYISNANREDMLLAMKEFIARAEGQISDNEQVQ